ncbi:glycosyltransferase family 4 protein [uncultured Dokdonia sp.]|uniref:glycosyltransferase family 4 protein n=1 Tax=uncultured Dokdonia sp. TaxID=575653 RepID=UPI0026110061|nr:glycosyltransferase family 4 protein [uncultured Dokdonia sp.]
MKILFLSYYFEPDLSAGSFRNTSLLKELIVQKKEDTSVDVISTFPNRYKSFNADTQQDEELAPNVNIHRVLLPKTQNNFKGQIVAYRKFYGEVKRLTKGKEYDLVYASSGRLFTAFLASVLARKFKCKLYLDIRDIFREGITEIFKSPFLKIGLGVGLRPIENYTFKRATHINLVSKGFGPYFEKYTNASQSFFTNGIDSIFINNKDTSNQKQSTSDKKTIVYAGNIGQGQGLDKVIPKAAKRLPDYKFVIIGDGGTKPLLKEALEIENITNVELRDPVKRDELLTIYNEADFLFLHLNTYKAFERVLPSKLFEYGAFNKPMIAGVGGYALDFIKEEVSNSITFKPTDVDDFVTKLENYTYKEVSRDAFVAKFSRESINREMVSSILNIASGSK